jgi:hypothetical protein
MSTPVNPLDKFRSYAYHHILIAASNTESLRSFLNGKAESVSNLKLGQKSKDGYYVICDTRKNSFFSITDISYSSTLNAGNSKMANIVFGSIDMSITDPSGITFLNYLNWLSKTKLQVNLFKTVFALKTIFVGFTADGRTETVYQDAIPMLMYDMTAEPSHRGSTLIAKFTPAANGIVVQADDFSRMLDVPGVSSKTKLLKDAVKAFENALNAKSRKWYKDLQIKIINNSKESDVQPSKGYGKLVQYMITVPDDWSDFKINGNYLDVTETKFKRGGTKENVETNGVNIGFNTTPTSTIFDALEIMMKQSDEVNKLASNDNRAAGNVRGYKILSNITSDDDTLVVHFDIVNYSIPKIDENAGKQTGKDTANKSQFFNIDDKKNVMKFEYIFTGKNADILNLNMKINNVNLFLADNLIISDQASQEVQKNQAVKPSDDTSTKSKDVIISLEPKDPVVPPMKTGSQQQNMSWSTETDSRKETVKLRQQFIHNMSMAHGISSFNVVMKIRGNPALFGRFSDKTLLPHVKTIDNIQDVKYVTTNDKFTQNSDTFFTQTDVQSYIDAKNKMVKEMGADTGGTQPNSAPTLLPYYVKVHIRGQDFDVMQKADSFSDFKPYEDLWYNGYYLVTKVDHHFSNGEFTQDLLIGAIPGDLYGQNQSDTSKEKPAPKATQDAAKKAAPASVVKKEIEKVTGTPIKGVPSSPSGLIPSITDLNAAGDTAKNLALDAAKSKRSFP